jgi:putative membrane protein
MSSAAHVPDSNEMAMERTWLARERTLMAWVRTATSMIGFGFTIYKFFQFDLEKMQPVRRGIFTPRDFALIMVGIGTASLLTVTITHRKYMRRMRGASYGEHSVAEVLAWVVSAFGLWVFVSTFFHD